MNFYPNAVNKSDYSYIYRKDTTNYTLNDLSVEIEEWVDIIHKLTGMKPNFEINEVKINPRLKQTFAQTCLEGWIEFSEPFLRHHGNPKSLHSVICHEVIHTFPDCWDHKATFKTIGKYLKYAGFDVQITRTYTDAVYSNYELAHSRQKETYKYKAVCEGCGQILWRKRSNADVIKNPQRWKCGKCGGKFKAYQITPDGLDVQIVRIAI